MTSIPRNIIFTLSDHAWSDVLDHPYLIPIETKKLEITVNYKKIGSLKIVNMQKKNFRRAKRLFKRFENCNLNKKFNTALRNHRSELNRKFFFCLLVLWIFRPTCPLVHMETPPLPVKGCKF